MIKNHIQAKSVIDLGNENSVALVPGIGLIYASSSLRILFISICFDRTAKMNSLVTGGATRAEKTRGNVLGQVQQVGRRIGTRTLKTRKWENKRNCTVDSWTSTAGRQENRIESGTRTLEQTSPGPCT